MPNHATSSIILQKGQYLPQNTSHEMESLSGGEKKPMQYANCDDIGRNNGKFFHVQTLSFKRCYTDLLNFPILAILQHSFF